MLRRSESVPTRALNIGSAWIGIESILFSLIKEFDVRTHVAVEFGVDEGYSLSALANYFGEVLEWIPRGPGGTIPKSSSRSYRKRLRLSRTSR